MIGAIIGDIVGSRFEWSNIKAKEFELFTANCFPTDDSVMTLAVAQAILSCDGEYTQLHQQAIRSMQTLGRQYPDAGYGGRFYDWINEKKPQPYNSWGNGAAMRVSACAWAASDLEEALTLSDAVTEVTHNHPEGMKGARAVTTAIFMAKQGAGKSEIADAVCRNYYALDFTLDDVRPWYTFDVSCQGSVPQAIMAFLEGASFEDAIRCAVSIGGDSDTIAAITGSIAEAFYGVPAEIRTQAESFLDETQLSILHAFEAKYSARRKK